MTLKRTRHLDAYMAIKELSGAHDDYLVSKMCRILGINRAAYYKWKNHGNSQNDSLNELIAEKAEEIHAEHPDRGYQYTSKTFRQKVNDAEMTQSMSRVGRCIDNGSMEGFWGTMKREMYYGRKYKTKDELIKAIEDYIDYYTNKRVQRNLGVVTPMEFYERKLQEAA